MPGSSDAPQARSPSAPIATPDPLAFLPPRLTRARNAHHAPRPSNDGMHIEDTPHRVYIHDLNAEFSDIESDEDTPIFLSDIEKHLSKIPKHVLLGPAPVPTEQKQLVLYNVPASLSVPQEHDGVRKAIAEARQRIRHQQNGAIFESDERLDGRMHMDAGIGDAMDID